MPSSTCCRNMKQGQSSQDDTFEVDDSDSNSSIELENKPIKLKIKLNIQAVPPAVAVPEKIIFCIDKTVDTTNGYLFEFPDSGEPPSISNIMSEAIRVFITNKLSIAKDTEFALVTLLPGNAELVLPLSSNINSFMNSLTNLKVSTVSETGDYDLTPVFDSVFSVVNIPQESKPNAIPPDYLIRLILVYSSSLLEPSVSFANEHYNKFSMSPVCVLDVIYLHDNPSDSNNVEQIFKSFGKIVLENSYLLENGRNVTTLFNKMAKLLAHPYQRVSQELWQF